MRFAAGNAQHIGSRPQQQDAFGFSDPSDARFVTHGGFLGIVADGVGGLTHGLEASQSAVRAFLQAYQQKSESESIPEALRRSLREANAAVLRVASEPSGEGAGTTLAAAVLHETALYWIAAGDSRIYLLHEGRLIHGGNPLLAWAALNLVLETDSRGYSYQQIAPVGGDLGGYFNLYYDGAPFTLKGKTIRIKNALRLTSPLRYRNAVTVSTDGGPFVNYGSAWFEKATTGSTK